MRVSNSSLIPVPATFPPRCGLCYGVTSRAGVMVESIREAVDLGVSWSFPRSTLRACVMAKSENHAFAHQGLPRSNHAQHRSTQHNLCSREYYRMSR